MPFESFIAAAGSQSLALRFLQLFGSSVPRSHLSRALPSDLTLFAASVPTCVAVANRGFVHCRSVVPPWFGSLFVRLSLVLFVTECNLPNPCRTEVSAHRSMTPDGHIIVKEDDRYDEVDVKSPEGTLQELLEELLTASGDGEDLKNWTVKVLEDGKCKPVAIDTTPAALHPEVVLVRKGG